MKTKIILGFLLLVAMYACQEEQETPTKVYDFSTITKTGVTGNTLSESDTTDWKLDTKFTPAEKALFDSIDFSKVQTKINTQKNDPIIRSYQILFYPNPVNMGIGSFSLPKNSGILNLVIVDSLFKKVISYKGNNSSIAIRFDNLSDGYYRAYYVFQDSTSYITGTGYGDIKVDRME